MPFRLPLPSCGTRSGWRGVVAVLEADLAENDRLLCDPATANPQQHGISIHVLRSAIGIEQRKENVLAALQLGDRLESTWNWE